VTRGRDKAFEEQGVITEGARGLATRGRQCLGEFAGVEDSMHAFAATAGGRFDEDGEPDIGRSGHECLVAHIRVLRAWHERDSAGGHGMLCGDLVAHGPDRVRAGAEEDDARGLAGGGELGVLGQEAVAGVDGLGTGCLCCGDDLVDTQIGFGGLGRAEVYGDVGGFDVCGLGVGVGVHGDGADAESAAGADDAQGDLSAVGDEYCVEHGGAHILKMP
jgi:hypothetical protein